MQARPESEPGAIKGALDLLTDSIGSTQQTRLASFVYG